MSTALGILSPKTLIIEVADSSLTYDREVKLGLYAKAGIPNYWILNLQENCLETYSLPTGSGVYQKREAYTPEEKVGIPGIRAGELSLDQVFSIG